MKNILQISVIQTNLYWGDINANLSNFDSLLSSINNTDIILLPEMFNTAFCPQLNHLAETMNGKTITWMKEKAISKKCAIVGTLMVNFNGKIYNRLIWVSEDGNIKSYDKTHLFSLAEEEKHLTKGKKRIIINEKGWKFCPLICYDLRFPVFSRNDVNYDVLIYLANWPIKRIDAWNTLLKARSIENQCVTIGVNRIGKDPKGIQFNGHSSAFDIFGKKLFCANEDKEQIHTIILNRKKIQTQKQRINFLKDRDQFSLR